jgi:hypothetical protein
MLGRIFEKRRNEITGDRRILRDKELHYLYASRNIIRLIKSRRMRWGGHATYMSTKRYTYRILVGKPEGKRQLRNVDAGRRKILKWISEKWDWVVWIGLIWLSREQWRALVNTVMNLRFPQNAG